MYKYSIEIPIEVIKHVAFDNWSKKEVYIGNNKDCLRFIQNNNIYQCNYSKLVYKTKKVTEWIEDIRYYYDIIPLDDWRLCDIPNKRRNAKLLTN
jgi:hypothetical protein